MTSYSTLSDSHPKPWVSILECGSAAGQQVRPYVIFTGINPEGQWFPDDIPDWTYDSTPSGWSNTNCFRKWFNGVFLPDTEPQDRSLWRILFLDGHKTYVTIDIMFTAWFNKVQLIYLPSHSSHISQPLDVGVFSPLKTYFHQQTRGFANFSTTAPMQKQRFIQAYQKASEKAFSKRNLRSGFRKAGIWPTNVTRLLDQVVEPENPPPPPRPRRGQDHYKRRA